MMKGALICKAVIDLCSRALFWELASKEEEKNLLVCLWGKIVNTTEVNIIHEKVGP